MHRVLTRRIQSSVLPQGPRHPSVSGPEFPACRPALGPSPALLGCVLCGWLEAESLSLSPSLLTCVLPLLRHCRWHRQSSGPEQCGLSHSLSARCPGLQTCLPSSTEVHRAPAGQQACSSVLLGNVCRGQKRGLMWTAACVVAQEGSSQWASTVRAAHQALCRVLLAAAYGHGPQ